VRISSPIELLDLCKTSGLWHRLICGYRRFGGTSVPFYPEHRGSMFLRKVGNSVLLKPTRCHSPKSHNLNCHCCKNVRSQISGTFAAFAIKIYKNCIC
jgi:hypothetical protein